MFNRGYLQQVTMIESECEPKRKFNPMNALLSKSPLRDRQNKMNLANTPSRMGKTSLSPLRSRRTESNAAPRSGLTKKKPEAIVCTNEPYKPAKYVTYSDDETLYYCEKCAILLASQGFSVMKLSPTESYEQGYNPRKDEIQQFMSELEGLSQALLKKQATLANTIQAGNHQYELEMQKINSYYAQFYQIIDQHKRRVSEELKEDYQQACIPVNSNSQELDLALKDTKAMQDDILQSMEVILYETDEAAFRPIMNTYNDKTQQFKTLLGREALRVNLRRLQFREAEAACQALDEGLHVEWETDKPEINYYSKQSDFENPVEAIETNQKMPKGSLKELGGLFSSSFDE